MKNLKSETEVLQSKHKGELNEKDTVIADQVEIIATLKGKIEKLKEAKASNQNESS